ncbi:MAG: 3-oxoacyl-ACP reductase FabG [Acetobacteraceae bacterium]
MALGLAEAGVAVVATGHIAADLAPFEAALAARGVSALGHGCVADIRDPAACDELLELAQVRFGGLDILVNNAGLTFTTTAPDRYRWERPQRFYECGDAVVAAVMDTNFVAADRLARRVAPVLVERGWGRIVNVTTKLDTMNRAGSSPYGPSKAALEMASEIWAKDLAGTGVTVNIVNPGAGANTPGIAEEARAASLAGHIPRLVEPEAMVAPLLFVVSEQADRVTGWRFDANGWEDGLPAAEAARRCGRAAGFVLHPPATLASVGAGAWDGWERS